jgi:hypothetical protein
LDHSSTGTLLLCSAYGKSWHTDEKSFDWTALVSGKHSSLYGKILHADRKCIQFIQLRVKAEADHNTEFQCAVNTVWCGKYSMIDDAQRAASLLAA